ncbi:unnamed protein product [Lampetra planeri]
MSAVGGATQVHRACNAHGVAAAVTNGALPSRVVGAQKASSPLSVVDDEHPRTSKIARARTHSSSSRVQRTDRSLARCGNRHRIDIGSEEGRGGQDAGCSWGRRLPLLLQLLLLLPVVVNDGANLGDVNSGSVARVDGEQLGMRRAANYFEEEDGTSGHRCRTTRGGRPHRLVGAKVPCRLCHTTGRQGFETQGVGIRGREAAEAAAAAVGIFARLTFPVADHAGSIPAHSPLTCKRRRQVAPGGFKPPLGRRLHRTL